MTNAHISSAFQQIADILSLQDENPFRIRAYERAAQTILSLGEDVSDIYKRDGKEGLLAIPGIGNDLADKMIELITTKKLTYLTDLAKEIPPGLLAVTGIQGMGPKKTKFVWKTFKVEGVDDLEKLAQSGKLDTQKGWGKKSVQNVLEGIAALRLHNARVALPTALNIALQMQRELQESGLCGQVEIAGSLRRRKESIGDIDILATSSSPRQVMDLFCSFGLVDRVLGKGPTKASVHLSTGMNADLRVVDEVVFGAAWHYFTGSKEHNIAVRKLGIAQGLTISEYGVYEGTPENKGELKASRTEEDVYKSVGLPYIEPELREDRGELEAAKKGTLPHLITVKDLKGDMHLHSNFSDGRGTITQMAEAAKKAGLEYIAITDHGSPMGMVRGVKEGNITEYLRLVDEARTSVKGLKILAGSEVDILEDGSLYLPDATLTQLDWVVVSVHGNFKLSPKKMTERIIRALKNPHVNVFAHPTSRLLLKRDPIEYDIDAVFRCAVDHHVCVEINAAFDRLDLNDTLARRAKDAGCMLTIDSDAHNPGEFDYRFGISQARRGWVEAKNVLNTRAFAEVEKWISNRRA
jgi:DNA polymerase (family X)